MVRISFQSLQDCFLHTQIFSKQALKALVSTNLRHFPGTHNSVSVQTPNNSNLTNVSILST